MNRLKLLTRLLLGLLMLSLIAAACTKKNPSSTTGSAGSKVLLRLTSIRASGERKVAVTGTVYNQSGLMIYDVRVGMVTFFRTDSVGGFTLLTDTSDADTGVVADSLPNKTESGNFFFKFVGDSVIDIYPVYTHSPL